MSQEESCLRRRRVLVLATTALILVAPGIAIAASFKFTPSAVPKHWFKAGALNIHARPVSRYSDTDRIRFNFDDHFRFAPSSVPASCNPFEISFGGMAHAMARCGSAKTGSGTVQFTHGTETYNGCALAFNRTPPDHLPRVLLFIRAKFAPYSTTIDCSNPRSNRKGNSTVLLQGTLRPRATGPAYKVQLDFKHITQAAGVNPINDLNLTLQRGRYITARCAHEDAFRGWQLRTKLTYINPSRARAVDSTQRCSAGW
jgi:hypothetical protein